MSLGEFSVWENVILGTVCRKKYLLREKPIQGTVLRGTAVGKFLWVTVPHENVRWETVLEALYPGASLGSSIFWDQPVSFILFSTKCFNILIMLIAFIRVFLLTLWCYFIYLFISIYLTLTLITYK